MVPPDGRPPAWQRDRRCSGPAPSGQLVTLYTNDLRPDRQFVGLQAQAITDGPAGLTSHALLGVAPLAVAVTLVVRAVLVRRRWPIALAVLGLCAIIVSAINGSRFVGDPSNAASLTMGIAAAVAVLCYVIIGFAANARPSS